MPDNIMAKIIDGNNPGSEIEMPVSEMEKLAGGGSIDRATRSDEGDSGATKFIMTLEEGDVAGNALRYDIKNYRTVVAFASLIQKCERNNDTDGVAELKLILGMTPSIKGRRVALFSDTIIGERKNFGGHNSGGMPGLFKRFENWALNRGG